MTSLVDVCLVPNPFLVIHDSALILNTDGFFDAGMLLQALKARGESLDNGDTKASERAATQARRRDVGKKLRLIDY